MYDKYPYASVSTNREECHVGWRAIGDVLLKSIDAGQRIMCVECYPGVFESDVRDHLAASLTPQLVIATESLLLAPHQLAAQIDPLLTDDPVFGMMSTMEIADFFDKRKVREAWQEIEHARAGLILIIGVGAAEIAPQHDLLIYTDMARWEIQQRQRCNEISNLGADNKTASAADKYKRAFFLDWRAADRLKQRLLPRIDFVLDTNAPQSPKMITGAAMRKGLATVVQRPFRVVPFFDPGPWGGHWMEKHFDLPTDVPNHAWCFDCVPEENSLLLGFGDERVEMPSINLVLLHPRELLGDHIYNRFGAEFPIRFDLLDTVGGGNLSLQVHPLNSYVRDHFGIGYTQDESYYMLDADEGASVYLGLRNDIEPREMLDDLQAAQNEGVQFDAERYVNKWPAKKHDHFLIPAGTIHCSGRGSMVLEISATPYIFTFKLWDWGRMGLDGHPRPIHLQRGAENIQWNRTANWVRDSLINSVEPLTTGDGWREERTGLHSLEFIETRRHWFTGTVPHHTNGTVNVLNLVEGNEAVIESPYGAFDPFIVHYAETFIVPAQVGAYTIRPHGVAAGRQCATIKAFVREDAVREDAVREDR